MRWHDIVVDIKYGHVHNFEWWWCPPLVRPFLFFFCQERDIGIIHLYRENVVEATVSSLIADRRRIWHSWQVKPDSDMKAKHQLAAYDVVRRAKMLQRQTEIFIQFKCVPHSMFAKRGARTEPNKLVISIQPDENIRLMVMAKTPGLDREGIRLREVPLDVGLANAFADHRRRIAYERLLLDLIEGDPTLFVRRDEVEAQWTWIDAIRAAWAEKGVSPRSYTAGSWGPSAAIALTERDGISWHE